MALYRKKPVPVEASRWWEDGDHPAVKPIPDDQGECSCRRKLNEHGYIETLEGTMRVCPGDWVITGVAGEHYPCKHEIFKQTYEPVRP